MLDRISALAGLPPVEAEGIRMSEAPDFILTQAAGDAKALEQSFPKLPEKVGTTIDYAGKTLFRIGPHQLWIVGHPPEAREGLYLTPLSSSRTRMSLEGTRARDVLAKCAAIDFHPKVFTPGTFAMTGIHHMPVAIHCVEPNMFHLYSMRTFALTLWEVLADAAYS